MKIISNEVLGGERVNYQLQDAAIKNSVYLEGESSFKECRNLSIKDSVFYGRYPFWHNREVRIANCKFQNDTRAGFWYDESISFKDVISEGIKPLRECCGVELVDSRFIGDEMLWRCRDVTIENVLADSAYFLFECRDIKADRLKLKGKYSFQYSCNLDLNNSELDTKDAFWHSEDCTIRNSLVRGEYVGWYSKNLTLINCRISGTQPFCYCSNLRLIDCTFLDGDRAFERSEVEATISGHLESIYNPYRARITYRSNEVPAVEIDDPERYHLDLIAETINN